MVFKIKSQTLQLVYYILSTSPALFLTYLTSCTLVTMNSSWYFSLPCFRFFGPCCPCTLNPPCSGIALLLGAFLDLSASTLSPHTQVRFSHLVLPYDPDHSLISVVTPLFIIIYLQAHLLHKTRVPWGKGLGFIHLCISSTGTDFCFTFLMLHFCI